MSFENPFEPETPQKKEVELSPEVQAVRVSLRSFEGAASQAEEELGYGTDKKGRIELGAVYDLRHALHTGTQKFSPEDLPKAILLRKGYRDRGLAISVGTKPENRLVVDMTPSRADEYFLPHSYTRYSVNVNAAKQWNPEDPDFPGIEKAKEELVNGVGVSRIEPWSGKRGDNIAFQGEPTTEEIDKIITAYRESVRTESGRRALEELEQTIADIKQRQDEEVRETLVKHLPLIKHRLHNLIRAVGSITNLPLRVFLTDTYNDKSGEKEGRAFYLPAEGKVVFVPLKTYKIFGRKITQRPNFEKERDATDLEFFNKTRLIHIKIEKLLPPVIRNQIHR